eukprot:2901322-Rhodomonas_salina.3
MEATAQVLRPDSSRLPAHPLEAARAFHPLGLFLFNHTYSCPIFRNTRDCAFCCLRKTPRDERVGGRVSAWWQSRSERSA